MKLQYAVAHLYQGKETIKALFDNEKDADFYAMENPAEQGVLYCFRAEFSGRTVVGEEIYVCSFYHPSPAQKRHCIAS